LDADLGKSAGEFSWLLIPIWKIGQMSQCQVSPSPVAEAWFGKRISSPGNLSPYRQNYFQPFIGAKSHDQAGVKH
jgi:hypothetical protein